MTATSAPSLAEAPDETLWEAYRQTGSDEARNALVERYLHLVRYNAERLHRKLSDAVDIEDLKSAGVFGLMDAIDGYDPARQIKFETYCSPRIYGAMLDEIRAFDWAPRLVRSRTARIENAARALHARTGHWPSDEEIAEWIGLDGADFEKIRRDASARRVISLSHKWYETPSHREVCEIDVLEDAAQDDPARRCERRDLKRFVTRGLPRDERLILVLYYYEHMTLKEIGATLDFSESRVSQKHHAVVARLKRRLRGRAEEVEALAVE